MKRTRSPAWLLGLGLISIGLVFGTTAQADDDHETDPETGLIIAPGFEEVKNNCIACHSARLITERGYTRAVWLEQIRWMQETQGLWEFTPEVEETILDYLETHYPSR